MAANGTIHHIIHTGIGISILQPVSPLVPCPLLTTVTFLAPAVISRRTVRGATRGVVFVVKLKSLPE